MLTITDDYDNGTALLCEKHFKKLRKYIAASEGHGVIVTVTTVKNRGCRTCASEKIGFSPWSGSMFKIWKGFKKNESR